MVSYDSIQKFCYVGKNYYSKILLFLWLGCLLNIGYGKYLFYLLKKLIILKALPLKGGNQKDARALQEKLTLLASAPEWLHKNLILNENAVLAKIFSEITVHISIIFQKTEKNDKETVNYF